MHVKVLTFRLAEEDQTDEAFAKFLVRIAKRNVLALREFGLLDGYVVRTARDTILTVNFYDTAENMYLAFDAVTGSPDYAASMNLTMVGRMEGEAYDLPLSLSEADLFKSK